jgi:hypothetical protein
MRTLTRGFTTNPCHNEQAFYLLGFFQIRLEVGASLIYTVQR